DRVGHIRKGTACKSAGERRNIHILRFWKIGKESRQQCLNLLCGRIVDLYNLVETSSPQDRLIDQIETVGHTDDQDTFLHCRRDLPKELSYLTDPVMAGPKAKVPVCKKGLHLIDVYARRRVLDRGLKALCYFSARFIKKRTCNPREIDRVQRPPEKSPQP